MRILIKREDFSTSRYELRAGSAALELTGEDGKFSLPYSGVRDFASPGTAAERRTSPCSADEPCMRDKFWM